MRTIVMTAMTAATLALGLTACGGDGDGDAGAGAAPPSAGQDGQRSRSAWGRLRYVAPGKFSVGDVVFSTSGDTVLFVAGGQCPDGSAPPNAGRCSVNGIDDWARASPHNVSVRFSGRSATFIQEIR
ncbi:hypothetical protein [Actinomadura oligospora]|uniref:hypothetical protein n=1 Tax=Actinomadura oligospora TaxID=111804 RepID=UPI0004793405|nr:hypothetical protein [Actinomadura oligospora]